MLDSDRLRDFMHRFFGYGSWDATLWFVGMEEGGGDSLNEIERRLSAWDGSNELADLRAFHVAIDRGGKNWFAARPPIQPTWGKLIRTALVATGRPNNTEAVRLYQRDELARHGKDTALIELLPLPSPSTSDWLYAQAGIESIATRGTYVESILPSRVQAIRDRIVQHKPAHVVFYGLAYRDHWEKIAASPFEPVPGERFEVRRAGTRYFLAPHPAAKGVRNSDYEAIGRAIAVDRRG